MSLIINRKLVKNFYKAELFYKLHKAKECIKLFEAKYGKSFKEFERDVKTNSENFEAWDDYMEWKSCIKELETVNKLLNVISNLNCLNLNFSILYIFALYFQ